MAGKIKVLQVDGHTMLHKWKALLPAGEEDIVIVGEAGDGEEAIAQVEALKPDIVVMDMSMLKLNVIEVTRQIVARFPHSKVIVLSINSARHIIDDLLRAGAVGYLLKKSVPEELLQCIRTVMRGDIYLGSATTGMVIAAYVEGLSHARPEDSLTVVTDILQTRLHPPVMTPDLVPRPRLFEQLDEGRVRPLILVSAGAGYGKSVLISSWLTTFDWSGAWLSLDQSDSDLRQFLRYFVAALRVGFPGACEQTFSLTEADQLPPLHILTTILCNELEAFDRPVIMVLDDYHRIDARSPVHELVQQILALPPIPLHLVILTRRDPPLPLIRLRAQNQVMDIRMKDLQFTEAETRTLMEKTTVTSISDDVFHHLQQEMEGWPVGLRLASLALNQVEDMESFLKDLHGGIEQIQEYLLYEVLTRQSSKLREWLLKTAILDRYCRPLIEAVCAVESPADVGGMNGEEFINSLLEKNTFTIPLDSRGEWFRYHHLFQHLLQRELDKLFSAEEIAGLHARAGQWFESEGLIEESLQHARAQGNNELVVQIVERHARPKRNEGKWYIVSRWMSQLPDEAVQQSPELLLSMAWEHYYHLNYAAIPALLDQVDTLMGGDADSHELSGEVAVFRGFFSFFSDQGAQSLKNIEHALERVPLTESEFRAQAEILFAIAGHHEGQQQRVIAAQNAWLDEQPLHPLREVSLFWGLFYVHYVSGHLQGAEKYCQQGLGVARLHDMKNFTGWFLYFEALIYLQRGELDAAIELLEQATAVKYYHYTRAAVDALVALILAYQMRAQSQQADTTLRTLSEFVRYLGPSFTGLADACATRLAIMQGQSAVSWLRTGPPPPAEMMVCWFEVPHITRCRALIAVAAAADLREAEQCLLEYTEKNEAQHNTLQMIAIHALLAIACEKQGKTAQAMSHLQQALALGQPSSIVFPFLELGHPMADLLQRLPRQDTNADFATQILSAFDNKALKKVVISQPEVNTKDIAWNVEPLTNRELDILELLTHRLRNKEIALRLFVSPETVKSHLKHLYDKLGVNNRREAAVKADKIISSLADQSRNRTLTEVE
jgi:LuxR family maltose regulon positive regulatory protein